jgi:DNA polymerase I-like protein with 3'-5' exonuclease and polymerase domains
VQKFGTVRLKESNELYEVMWVTNDSGFVRVDVVDSFLNYNIIDTSNAVAAYYKKQQERFLGNVDIIKRMFRVKTVTATLQAKVEQKIEVVDGQVVITEEKRDDKLGIHSKVVMTQAVNTYEEYEDENTLLIFDAIDKDRGMEVNIVNLNDYEVYSVSSDKFVTSKTVGDYHSEEYLRAKYPIGHLDDMDLCVVDSMETAIKRLNRWINAPDKVKAIDLETTGLEWCMFGKDVIVGISLSYNENESTYYPFRQENFPYNLPISFIQTILDAVANQPEDTLIIGHNAKVEIQGIWKEDKHYVGYSDYARSFDPEWEEHALDNPHLRIDGDSFILSILVNPVFKKGLHSLKSLALRIRGKFFLELEDIFVDKNDVKFNVLPPNIVKLYACPDTANTIAVWKYLVTKLPKDEFGILALEAKLLYVTAENEFYGMRTRRDKLIDEIENQNYIVNMLGEMFKKIHKTSKNINSNQVRADIFYNKLRAPILVRTKKGGPSTSNIALQAIIDSGVISNYDSSKCTTAPIRDLHKKIIIKGEELESNRYPSLVILQHYAKAVKELGALKRIERKSLRDRVMFNINQAGAATGRRTSDAHQYSDAMKEIIISDADEFRFWSADFKQIELRILAYLARQKNLIELESNPDVDVHRAILSIITGKPIWAITAKERKKGKSTNFGVVYMMSAKGLARKNKGPKATNEDIIEAMKSINDFYNGLPNIKKFVADNETQIRTKGFIRDELGRYRYFKEVLDPDASETFIASKVRAGNNMPVQGFGADLLKICECKMKDYIREKGWDEKVCVNGVWLPKVRMMLSIHDEVLLSTHKSIPHEEIIIMFKKCMEIVVKDAPPFFSSPAMVSNWLDGKNDSLEIDIRFRDEVVEAWENGHKRILHADTYDDNLDYKQIASIEDFCKQVRAECLTDADYENGNLNPTDITKHKVRKEINNANLMDTLTRHFISSAENIDSSDIQDTVIMRVLDKNYSHYLEDLNRYRGKRLKDYMDELIAKYKTVDAVAEHVRHPELTHTLISVEIGKKEEFEHLEAIHEATRRYMEGADVSNIIQLYAPEEDDSEIASYEDLVEYMEFDQNGEMVVDDADEDEDDIDELVARDFTTSSKREFAVYMRDDVIIDLSDYTPLDKKAEDINQSIAKLSGSDKPYHVVYFMNDRLLNSKLRIDYIPKEINEIFSKEVI